MRQFYKFLYAEGLRTDDPTAILDAPKKERTLPKNMSEADVSRLLERATQEANEPGDGRLSRLRSWSCSNCSMQRGCVSASSYPCR